MTSERVCGSHPSDRSPRTAWHQAGAGVAVHIRTGDDDCAKAKLEPRTSAVNGKLEKLNRKGFMWLSSRHGAPHPESLRTIPHVKPSLPLARDSIDDRAITNGALTAARI